MAFRKPWDIDLSSIRSGVRLWHGAEDQYSPVRHTRWLAKQIPGAELEIKPGVGHFEAMQVLPEILSWLSRGLQDESVRAGDYPVTATVPGIPHFRISKDPADPALDRSADRPAAM
jgi:hypothetical protein